ncbi:unnamed protein product [Adineta ricciae]|uniref:Uncharacterized protein n=1 Tax=Adineta ricciae TaxID=249248 RepID=A0A815BI75_ADIRI|nr:unnamed protein product [Adineta ricciae]CAF1432032.1 unnamed protein product [Adineta ricciae]
MHADGRNALRRLEYGAARGARGLEYGALGAARGLEYGAISGYEYGAHGIGPLGGLGLGAGVTPAITILVPWTPQFGLAYQQFVNGGYGGLGGIGALNGIGSYGLGGLGGYGGVVQGVPYGFGVTTY